MVAHNTRKNVSPRIDPHDKNKIIRKVSRKIGVTRQKEVVYFISYFCLVITENYREKSSMYFMCHTFIKKVYKIMTIFFKYFRNLKNQKKNRKSTWTTEKNLRFIDDYEISSRRLIFLIKVNVFNQKLNQKNDSKLTKKMIIKLNKYWSNKL
jgi:hypothetical protein